MATFTTRDGATLHLTSAGSGPAVLLIGGFTARTSMFRWASAALVDAGFTAITLDRRHHGESDFTPWGLRMSRHGADVHEVLQHLDLPSVHLVGSSMGASTIWALVDTFGLDGIASVTCIDQTPRMVNSDGWDLGLHGLTWEGLDGFVTRFPDGLSPFHTAPPAAVVELMGSDPAPPYPLDDVRPLLRDHAVQDWRDVVTRIDVPALAVGGRHSPMWPVEGQAWIAEHSPRGELVILEDSGHAPFLDAPEAFNAALTAFLHTVG